MPPTIDWKNPDYGPVWLHRLSVLKALRADENAMAGVKVYYQTHPADFINDWMSTFDPRNVERGMAPTMPFMLFPKQREFIDWLYARWKSRDDGVVEKSRDMGASWLCVGFSVWMWIFYPGSVLGFGSRKETLVDQIGDPNSLFWKIRECVKLIPPDFRPQGYDPQVHAPFMRLINPENAAVIVGEAGANIGRGARCSVYFKDESAFYEQPQLIDNALSQTSNCCIDISTPNGVGNPFWQKAHGGKLPKFVFDWRDDPRKDKAWYDSQVAKKDSVSVAQEIDRDYSASVTNSWIPAAPVDEAMNRGPADMPPLGGAPLRVGLDVARFGDDKTVLTFRRGRMLIRQTWWKKTDLMSTAGRAKQEIDTFVRMRGVTLEQIAIDTIGIGAGVADAMRGWYDDGIVVDVNSSIQMGDDLNYNLRSFMWREMKTWLEESGPALPKSNQELRVDLTGLRYFYRGGLLLIESKDDAKKRGLKSPDFGDSLALTFGKPGPAKKKSKAPPGRVVDYGMLDHSGVGL
jgi:phage terminase large subunit